MKNNSKQYWILTSEYPPAAGGGISTYCIHTARMLEENNYAVSIFIADKTAGKCDIEITSSGRRLVRFNPLLNEYQSVLGYETLTSFVAAETIGTFIKKEGAPEILESQDYNGLPYFLLLFKHLNYEDYRHLKILVTIHAPSFLCLPHNHAPYYRFPFYWIQEMEKYCLQAADIIIAPSEYVVKQVRSNYPELNREIHICRNPYYNEASNSSAAVKTFNPLNWVFYGKAVPLKGIMELLRLVEKKWESTPGFTLTVVGGMDYYYYPEGDLMDNCIKKKYSRQINNNQLKIQGSVKTTDLPLLLEDVSIVCIPSVFDNFPYAAVEMMAMGKILLTTISGGQAELITHNENGFLFNLEQEETFESAFSKLSLLSQDEVLKISGSAINTVLHCTNPAKIFKQKAEIIEKHSVSNCSTYPFIRSGKYLYSEGECHVNNKCTVIIPYYNMGSYIDECLDSLMTNQDSIGEIIIVNDGSTDDYSINKLKELNGRHPLIHVLHQQNRGLPAARNAGASIARGKYLAFLDADDCIRPGYYSKSIDLLEKYINVHFISCWAEYFGEASGIWPAFNPEPPLVLIHNMINTSSMVVRKKSFLSAGLNDSRMIFGMEDYDSLLGMLEHDMCGIVIPEPYFKYRVRKNSMARKFNAAKVEFLYSTIANKHRNLFNKYGNEISNLLNSNGPGFSYDNPTKAIDKGNKLVNRLLTIPFIQNLKSNTTARKILIPVYRRLKK